MGGQDSKKVGFYKNANSYRESQALKPWPRNNWYVYANKIYYRASDTPGTSSRELTRSPEFIPVIFDGDNEEDNDMQENGSTTTLRYKGVYDLQGRQVATEEMVKSGAWRNSVAPGVYILNGRKVMKR